MRFLVDAQTPGILDLRGNWGLATSSCIGGKLEQHLPRLTALRLLEPARIHHMMDGCQFDVPAQE